MAQYYCKTCGRTMDEDQFYQSYRIDRYPKDGKLLECKKCITRHVDNWDPETYKWILEEIDVPYIPDEWNNLLQRYGTDRKKLTGMTILGRYLSKMKLNQYREYRWEDTERLAAEAEAKKKAILEEQGFDEEEIATELKKDFTPEKPAWAEPVQESAPEAIDLITPDDFNDDLTDEDRKYLAIKWGKAYKPYEWVQLEQFYVDMMAAFDIQTPAHIDYLKLICKTSLKAHQLLDIGDVEGFQKLMRTYDMLMKSAKFTAAQNKSENGEYVNAVAELVKICEQEGFIPTYYVDGPKDRVDETLADMQKYTDTLVREEMHLGDRIEAAIIEIQKSNANEADLTTDDGEDDEDFEMEDLEELKDEDFEEHYEFLEDEEEEDAAIMQELVGEDEDNGIK